jgi:hypothetical protein
MCPEPSQRLGCCSVVSDEKIGTWLWMNTSCGSQGISPSRQVSSPVFPPAIEGAGPLAFWQPWMGQVAGRASLL